MTRPATTLDRKAVVSCLVGAAVALLLLSTSLAAGHGHHRFEIEEGDCSVCLLQQVEGLSASSAPTLAPVGFAEPPRLPPRECQALNSADLLEPERGPPTRV